MLAKRLREIEQHRIADLLEKRASFVSPAEIEHDLAALDYPLVQRLLKGENLFVPPAGTIEPVGIIPYSFAKTKEAVDFVRHGQCLLREGSVAVVVVAGGQGSRLGIPGPKGVVKVSPVRGKSLLCLHAQKILALQKKFGGRIPFFIMTSRVNDAETKTFFAEHDYFGLAQDEVFFFAQGMLPSLTQDGKFILGRDGALFMNPDGHGGTLSALQKNGCLDIMQEKGVQEIFYFQVDNPLIKICDPLFIGLHNKQGAQMSSKILRKRDCDEKVGVIAKVNNKTTVIEYSDMSKDMKCATDAQGKMVYWAGSIAIHMLRVDFVAALTALGLSLPYHKAIKKIPTLDEHGNPVEIEGIKFETFIFDALPMSQTSVTLEVKREEEFAPVKNSTGEDSLESSMAMQVDLHRSWLEAAGIKISSGVKVEISPLFAIDEEDVKMRVREIPQEIREDAYLG
jgi:UDP-N-acetylglucosamine/UDP-N-acetylgalactosamine diphosphorylase